jgi:hypothetical protein
LPGETVSLLAAHFQRALIARFRATDCLIRHYLA